MAPLAGRLIVHNPAGRGRPEVTPRPTGGWRLTTHLWGQDCQGCQDDHAPHLATLPVVRHTARWECVFMYSISQPSSAVPVSGPGAGPAPNPLHHPRPGLTRPLPVGDLRHVLAVLVGVPQMPDDLVLQPLLDV